ncbi:MAG: pilus assembly protein TadG-related protein [Hyphomicrobiaceae bacterium]|nr:pilus assembly protein TadG-related protein [Hyphomicrobiaceae bacterium]
MSPRVQIAALRQNLDVYRADERGGIAIISSAFFMVAIGVCAFAIDLGSLYLEKRRAQSFTDLAAMAAAADLPNAEAAARATLVSNNIDISKATIAVQLGNYIDSGAVATRFKVGVLPLNAARVTMTKPGQIFFAKTFMGDDCCNMTVAAVSANDQRARYTIGSRLLGLNGGVINELLGGLLGGNVNLSVMDYNALAAANVSLFDLGNALGVELGLTAASFSDILNANATVGNVLNALASVTQANGNTTANAAVKSIKNQSNAGSTSISLGKLLGTGSNSASTAQASVMDIVSAAATIANSGKMVDVSMGALIPGVADLKVSIAIGEPMQQSAWVRPGDQGATLHTAQTRIRIVAQVLGSIGLVKLPLYIDAASADARMTNIACAADGSGTVTVAAKPGIASAAIGEVSDADLKNLGPTPATVNKANIVDLPIPLLPKVKGQAATQVTNVSESNLTFTQAEIAALTTKSVSTRNISETLVSSLVSTLSLQVTAGPLSLPLDLSTLWSLLSGVAAPLDQVVNTLLMTLGIRLGQVDVRVQGVRCGGSMLAS